MKIICTKSNLAKGVSIVSKAVPSKTTMPVSYTHLDVYKRQFLYGSSPSLCVVTYGSD